MTSLCVALVALGAYHYDVKGLALMLVAAGAGPLVARARSPSLARRWPLGRRCAVARHRWTPIKLGLTTAGPALVAAGQVGQRHQVHLVDLPQEG